MKYSILFTAILPIVCNAHADMFVKRDNNISDVDVLNFALTLEHLENAFYSQGLGKFSAEQFSASGYPPWVRGRFQEIAEHEKTHVDFLTTALKGANAPVAQPCNYNFDSAFTDPKAFVEHSAIFETVGTSAYNGAASLISNKDYLTAAGTILAVEARHSGWIDSSVKKDAAWSGSFEIPLDLSQAYHLASSFIVDCPSSNPPLPVKTFANLDVPASPRPGQEITLSFDSSVTSLTAAFLTSNAGTIFVPINSDKTVTIPGNLKGTVYLIVTSDSTKVTDDTTVAGPAIMMFPFNSEGNLI